MKGSYMPIMLAVISVILVAIVLFFYWDEIRGPLVKKGADSLYAPGGIMAGLLRKKGIVLTTTMLATVVFVVVGAIMLFVLFAGISGETGSAGSGFFFNIFDAIIRALPWVS